MSVDLVMLEPVPTDNTASSGSSATSSSTVSTWRDWLGMVASIGCAIHCAAMPFVIAYLPALGLSFLADESFHQWMAVGCFVIALIAFIPGLRQHKRWLPIMFGGVGLLMISTAAFGFAGDCCAHDDAGSGSASAAAGCTDECCPHCPSGVSAEAKDGAGVAAVTAAPTDESPTFPVWVSEIAFWLTPIGGIVLVCAHLLNRHYGCLCGCCTTDVTEEQFEDRVVADA